MTCNLPGARSPRKIIAIIMKLSDGDRSTQKPFPAFCSMFRISNLSYLSPLNTCGRCVEAISDKSLPKPRGLLLCKFCRFIFGFSFSHLAGFDTRVTRTQSSLATIMSRHSPVPTHPLCRLSCSLVVGGHRSCFFSFCVHCTG